MSLLKGVFDSIKTSKDARVLYILFFLLILGGLIILAQSPAAAPLIFALF